MGTIYIPPVEAVMIIIPFPFSKKSGMAFLIARMTPFVLISKQNLTIDRRNNKIQTSLNGCPIILNADERIQKNNRNRYRKDSQS